MPRTVYEQCIKTQLLWLVFHKMVFDIKESILVFWGSPKNILKSESLKATKPHYFIHWRLEVLQFKVMVAFFPLRTLSLSCGWLFSWIHMACSLFFLFQISTHIELWPSHTTLLNFSCFFFEVWFLFWDRISLSWPQHYDLLALASLGLQVYISTPSSITF